MCMYILTRTGIIYVVAFALLIGDMAMTGVPRLVCCVYYVIFTV